MDTHEMIEWDSQKAKSKDDQMHSYVSEVNKTFNHKRSAALYGRPWNLEEITKATMLLRHTPINQIFLNEFDMRKIFCLVYDVYRRKEPSF